MKYSVSSVSPANLATDCLIVPIWNKTVTGGPAKNLDSDSNKAISKILNNGDLSGTPGETLLIHGLEGIKAKRILLIGCGDPKKLDAKRYLKLIRACLRVLPKIY